LYLLPGKWLYISTMKCATNTLYKALPEQVPGVEWAGGNNFHAIPGLSSHPIPVGGTRGKANLGKQMRLAPVHWTVVRNPYDRAVSIWASTCVRKSSRKDYPIFKHIQSVGGNPLDFDDFVDHILVAQPDLPNPYLYRNQSDWISRFICDLHLPIETLKAELDRRLGISLELPMENKSEHSTWEQYYTAETKQKVCAWAGKDFANYGYNSGIENVLRGRALPGEEARAETLDIPTLNALLRTQIFPGTVNIQLTEPPTLGEPQFSIGGEFDLWPCKLDGDEWTKPCGWVDGWIIKFAGEELPTTYIEVISNTNVRNHLSMQDFPSFICKLML